LIEVLDQRKDEAIQRTFTEVSKNFESIFEKLVPMGRGALMIHSRIKTGETQEDEMDVDNEPSSADNYTGVGIKVPSLNFLFTHRCRLIPRRMKGC
jgi:structural maintenance of chromosome 3 (chondroitin sulfate proteoglycan 6)